MSIIHYRAPLQLLVAVRGHPFDRNAFAGMFDAMPGVTATFVDQPAASQLMNPHGMRSYHALVLYDMPGLDFTDPVDPPAYVSPDDSFVRGLRELLHQGLGVVALHHSLAGWPDWPEYAEWLGGRFLYHPGDIRGARRLDSGYAHDVTYEARVLTEHPVTRDLPASFEMTDELYLAEVFESDVTALLASSSSFTRDDFWSAEAAVRGRMYNRDGWEHPPGSNLIGWTKRAINSPLVYLQPGDGVSAFENTHYRRLLENAIRWVAAESASR